ncbi:helix-turn-helix domain-containing protein [Pseudarthrobacter sp902506025]|uniref:ArsR/SmtB family transcription factor n=1 Tax=Pseudarthrobacter sp. 902506025 TaxID=3155291 RepID=UPI00344ED8D1
MNRTRSRLLRFLIAHGPASCGVASLALGLSQSTVRRQIMLLCEAGLVSPLAGSFSAQVEQIKEQIQELSAGFHCPVTDLRSPDHEGALLSESSFHSCECPGTAEETN